MWMDRHELLIMHLLSAQSILNMWMITCVLGEVYPVIVSDHLVPVWHAFATFGTPAQAKLAIRCLCSHTVEPVITHILAVCSSK